jgi:amino acid transporter
MSVNGLVTTAPAGGRLTSAGVLSHALAAATPIAVVVVIPTAYAGTLPLIFAVVGLIMLIFSVGFGAMSRRSPNAGALYAMVARGLGRPLGIGVAWIALLSYSALQIAAYGLIARYAIGIPWWQAVIAGWAVVALLGFVRADLVGWLLALLVLAEVVVIVGYGVADVLHPFGGEIVAPSLTLPPFDGPALGLLLVSAALAFVGFETTAAYAEEARSIRRASYLAVLVLAVLYAGSAWAMQVAAGPALASTAHQPSLIFDLAAARLTPWAVTLGRVVVLTGLLAGAIALHHTIRRYLFALGRDRVLPRGLGRPAVASGVQSLLIGAGLVVAGHYGASPGTRLVQWLGVGGGIGMLVLLTLTSMATLLYLNRTPNGENAWQRFVAPGLATVASGTLGYLALANQAELLGLSGRLVWALPGALAAAIALGLLVAVIMRTTRPVVYAAIGLGGTAVVVSPTAPPVPEQRTPGAHRPERVNRKLSA